MEIYGNCHIWEICKKSLTETNFTIAELSSWPSTRWKWWSKSSPRGSSWTTTPTFETPGTGWILLSYSQACILYNCICSCILFLLRESFMISKKVSPSPSCRLPHFLRWARQPGRTQNLQGSQGPQDGFHNARLNSHPKHLTWKLNLSAPSRPNISEPRFFNPFLRFCHLLLLVFVECLKEFSNSFLKKLSSGVPLTKKTRITCLPFLELSISALWTLWQQVDQSCPIVIQGKAEAAALPPFTKLSNFFRFSPRSLQTILEERIFHHFQSYWIEYKKIFTDALSQSQNFVLLSRWTFPLRDMMMMPGTTVSTVSKSSYSCTLHTAHQHPRWKVFHIVTSTILELIRSNPMLSLPSVLSGPMLEPSVSIHDTCRYCHKQGRVCLKLYPILKSVFRLRIFFFNRIL